MLYGINALFTPNALQQKMTSEFLQLDQNKVDKEHFHKTLTIEDYVMLG